MRIVFLLLVVVAHAIGAYAHEIPHVGKYQFITLTLPGKSIILIRCNTQTGESYYRLGNKWFKGVEANPIEPSQYLYQAQSFGDNAWIFVRGDINSGRMWTLQGEVWRVVLEAPETMHLMPQQPSSPSPAPHQQDAPAAQLNGQMQAPFKSSSFQGQQPQQQVQPFPPQGMQGS